MRKGKIYIGTSGYDYRHWKGEFYPEDLPRKAWLSFYADHFNALELNTTFYRLPRPAAVSGWAETAPRGFRFCTKMSRYITQMKKLLDPEESLQRYFDTIVGLGKTAGPVLIQLPPTLPFHRERVVHFFRLLKQEYSHYRFALEVRHASWLAEESLSLMRDYKIAFVIAEAADKDRFPYAEHVTARHIYVRFHGPAQLYASPYSRDQLAYYAGRFTEWSDQGHTIYAFFNNDGNGYAVQNALSLMEMIQP
jgi:uncharacterized protein YecE (DUF72 family)